MLLSQSSAIFDNLCQKMAFCSKTNVISKFFTQFSFVLCQKRNIFKNHNIGLQRPLASHLQKAVPHLDVAEDARVVHDAGRRRRELLPLQDPPPREEGLRLLELVEEGDLLQLLEQPELDDPLVEGDEPDAAVVELVYAVAAEIVQEQDDQMRFLIAPNISKTILCPN
jgi:hypothetical protein